MKTTRTALALIGLALILPASPSVYADPPPWAPAHGWRKKHDPYYTGYSGKRWDDDYGIVEGTCDRDKIGAVLGGVVGGAIGSTVGKGDGRTVAIIIGSVLGAVVGHQIGEQMDKADRACIGHALELASDRNSVVWDNPNSGLSYRVTPVRGLDIDGRKCREYDLAIRGDGVNEKRREKACQVSEGTWKPM
ncbi:type I secretion protein ATPase [Novimethylophilus kurashikiensis]|uniref:Type I secretion protein ATPase n=1 Tax=Novimethylophilus kurashikiensis TaxID=1825523 RepID=A0A2R5F2T1_9PROT|nr:glycine zipper 2TM domain-containing protein [Novimethylophilus kurashikiensis]GBG12877.1 type I secretion protein ATPase [Novimethylophilus kurashikiensis]